MASPPPVEAATQMQTSREHLSIHAVSGEVVATLDCGEVANVRAIKAKICSAIGGRVRLMRLLHKDKLLGDEVEIACQDVSAIAPLTLVHESAARIAFLPNFDGLYSLCYQLDDMPAMAIGIDSADFSANGPSEEDPKWQASVVGTVLFRPHAHEYQELARVIKMRGTIHASGILNLVSDRAGEEDFGNQVTLRIAPNGNDIQFTSQKLPDSMGLKLTRMPSSNVEYWQKMFVPESDLLWARPVRSSLSDPKLRPALQRMIRSFANAIVGVGVDVTVWSYAVNGMPGTLRMDREASQIELQIGAVQATILFTDVGSFEKGASEFLLRVVHKSGVQTSLTFDNMEGRNEAYTCLKIFLMSIHQ